MINKKIKIKNKLKYLFAADFRFFSWLFWSWLLLRKVEDNDVLLLINNNNNKLNIIIIIRIIN